MEQTAWGGSLLVDAQDGCQVGDLQDFNQFQMTKLCKFYKKGLCKRGRACTFAHGKAQLVPRPDLFRTQLCIDFLKTGRCSVGGRCKFAHGEHELRAPAPEALHGGLPEFPGLGLEETEEALRLRLALVQQQAFILKAQLACMSMATAGAMTGLDGEALHISPGDPQSIRTSLGDHQALRPSSSDPPARAMALSLHGAEHFAPPEGDSDFNAILDWNAAWRVHGGGASGSISAAAPLGPASHTSLPDGTAPKRVQAAVRRGPRQPVAGNTALPVRNTFPRLDPLKAMSLDPSCDERRAGPAPQPGCRLSSGGAAGEEVLRHLKELR